MMKDFVDFLLSKVFDPKPIDAVHVERALVATVNDVRYHFPDLDAGEIMRRIQSNANELAVFLFRLGAELHMAGKEDLIPQVHGLMRQLCGCEIYFNNSIATGFYVIHGVGTVIGSRNTIGRGFKIHHGCTIGHRINGQGAGSRIGNDVTVYCNSSIIGSLEIGDNAVIGAHQLITDDVAANQKIFRFK